MEIDCANCGEPNALCNFGDVMVCDDCSFVLGGDLVGEIQERAERAEAELAKALKQLSEAATLAHSTPNRRVAEARAVGHAPPWWGSDA